MSTEMLERVRMCLAEAGYDQHAVGLGSEGEIRLTLGRGVPHFAAWRAMALAGDPSRCWPCSRENPHFGPGRAGPCGHPVDPFCAEDAEVVS